MFELHKVSLSKIFNKKQSGASQKKKKNHRFALHGIFGGYFVCISEEDDNAGNIDCKGPQASILNTLPDSKYLYYPP